MQRQIHQLFGLFLLPILMVLAISGALLAAFPILDAARVDQPDATITVAHLAYQAQQQLPRLERIERKPSGKLVAHSYADGVSGAYLVDPASGAVNTPYQPSQTKMFLAQLHRALFLGQEGRALVGIGAGAMLTLCLSGTILLARRMGGWLNLLKPISGSSNQKLHLHIARLTLLGLTLSSMTGLYLSLDTFGVIPSSQQVLPEFPIAETGPVLTIDAMPALQQLNISELRELTFPFPDDPSDVFTVITHEGAGYIGQASGELLAFAPNSLGQHIRETFFMLHTGEGLPWIGALLGIAALGVPFMSVSGTAIWMQKRRSGSDNLQSCNANEAETIILVGSEGNTTWRFANALHRTLSNAGQKVHIAELNAVANQYAKAERMLILASTYGDGDAPQSATKFLSKLQRLASHRRFAVSIVGFGDSQYPKFCAYAHTLARHLRSENWPELLPMKTIDRQSPSSFADWVKDLSATMGLDLTIDLAAPQEDFMTMELVQRTDYGHLVQAPTSVLRFALPAKKRRVWPLGEKESGFQSGDLLKITPTGETRPRYYSLASASKNGFAEICVRHVPGGVCSGALHQLEVGDTIEASVQPNPSFHLLDGSTPLILIGAGSGIGPLVGFVRNNHFSRPIHLYYGARHPSSDFIYRRDLDLWKDQGRVTSVNVAFSRNKPRVYVQDLISSDEKRIGELIADGAQVMVCGGREMAAGVSETMDLILNKAGLDVRTLKAQGRYCEDVY